MSELRSVIETLRSESLSALPDARIEEDFSELQAAVDALEAERLRRLAEIDRRRLFERDGNLSAVAWLADRFRMGWGAARQSVTLARGLDRMAGVRRAFEDGAISLSAVRLLADARDAEPEAFTRAEAALVEAASRHSIGGLRRVATHWRLVVESQRSEQGGSGDRLRACRRFHASVTLSGVVRVDGDLDPETGETLLTALGAVLDHEARSRGAAGTEDRTPAQRRADALGEICRQWLDRRERPEIAGERPHLTVTVPVAALTGVGGEPGELDHVGPVDTDLARRLACDASVTRVVLSPRSEPLDVGRRTSVISPTIRRAVITRDRHCRFPGCDRPQSWCDAHHVVHWADGGATSVGNLLLLCRRHHRAVHHRRFSLEIDHGRPVFRRTDGSVLEGRSPP